MMARHLISPMCPGSDDDDDALPIYIRQPSASELLLRLMIEWMTGIRQYFITSCGPVAKPGQVTR